jgi:four helix bundle protein
MAGAPKAQIRSHRDLIVWQRAVELVHETYRLTKSFPRREEFGLAAQMRRSAVSIPANIAEGHARRATGDYLRFLSIANGSLRELETYWDVVLVLKYANPEQLARALDLGEQTGRMLMKLRAALQGRLRP